MGADILFRPLTVGAVTLRNRIVMPPMVSNTGIVSRQGLCWYRERARGGVGLVIVEATSIERFRDAEFVRGLDGLVAAVKGEGAAIAIQLFLPPQANGEAVSVSGEEGARRITASEIKALVAEAARAAEACRIAGFDGVEPHGAHGFFLNQFFSTRFNRRGDEFGGGLEGRMRLGLEVVRSMREAIGREGLLLYRHTPAEDADGGYGLEDTLEFAPELVKAGVDVLDISPSTGPTGVHCDRARAVKQRVSAPVIAVGGMRDAAAAAAALQEGKCDLVAVGRQLIADAHWPAKVRAGQLEAIIGCRECNEGCHGGLRRGESVGCVYNPASGNEYLQTAVG